MQDQGIKSSLLASRERYELCTIDPYRANRINGRDSRSEPFLRHDGQLDRARTLDNDPMKKTPLCTVEGFATMHCAAIVPHYQVVHTPSLRPDVAGGQSR